MTPRHRRRLAKGRWMKLRSAKLLIKFMEMPEHNFSQARLARYAGVSRQFIHMLVTEQKTTCTPAVARRIEEAFRLPEGALFDPKESPARGPAVHPRATKEKAA